MYYNGHYRWYAQNGGTGGNPSNSTAGTGTNIKVAVADTGVNSAEASTGTQISVDATNSYDYVNNTSGATTDDNGHGTHVAGIIAAPKNSSGMHGIAYNSTILNLKVINAAGSVTATDAEIGNSASRAYDAGAMIINNSWGSTTAITSVTAAQLNASIPDSISGYKTYVANGGVVVWAAGNSGLTQVSYQAGLPYRISGLEAGWLAVISVDMNGNETAYTNRCGVAAEWCITAPGGGDNQTTEGIYSMYNDGSYKRLSGTSMAAPMVSGALAALKSMFPNLSYQQVRDRLLTTANRTGQYATSSIFGQGLMDLDAASSPVGGLSLPTSKSDRGSVASYAGTKLTLSEGALLNRLKSSYVLALDNYQRAPFYVSAENFVRVRKNLNNFSERHIQFIKRESEPVSFGDERHNSSYIPGLNSAVGIKLGAYKLGFGSGVLSESSLAKAVGVSYLPHFSSGEFSSNSMGSSFQAYGNQLAMMISVPNKQNNFTNESTANYSVNGMGQRNSLSLIAEHKIKDGAYGLIYSHAEKFDRPLGILSSGAFAFNDSKAISYGIFYTKGWAEHGFNLRGSAEISNLSTKSKGLLDFEGGRIAIYKVSADKVLSKTSLISGVFKREKALQGQVNINIPSSIDAVGTIGFNSFRIGLNELIDSSQFAINLSCKLDKTKSVRFGVLHERKSAGLNSTGAALLFDVRH